MAVTRTSAQILTAGQTLVAVANAPGNTNNSSALRQTIREALESARAQYKREYALIKNVAFADASSATITALFTALSIADGDAFRCPDADDTTNDALQAAKGGVVVAGDVFNRVGATAVFVGIAANVPSDVTGLDAAIAG